MDEKPFFQLIQAVDPTKKRVPINEKFAKLTLSSNKKKHLPEEATLDGHLEQRKSASRNLLKDLSLVVDASEADTGIEGQNFEKSVVGSLTENEEINRQRDYVNPLLRSPSSIRPSSSTSQSEIEEIKKLCPFSLLRRQLQDLNNASATMEHLQISLDASGNSSNGGDNESNPVNTLIQQISTLSIVGSKKKNNSDNFDIEEEIVRDVDEPEEIEEKLLRQTTSGNISVIDIVSLVSDVDHTSTDGETSAITVSDTSLDEKNNNEQGSVESSHNYMQTSDIPRSSQSTDILLPPTLNDDKSERIKAFLHDISLERRKIATIDHSPLLSSLHPLSDRTANRTAFIDTEFETLLHRPKYFAVPDTEILTEFELQTKDAICTDTEIEPNTNTKYYSSRHTIFKVDNVHRMVSADTEPMTVSDANFSSADTLPMMQPCTLLPLTGTPLFQTQFGKTEYNEVQRLANQDTQLNSTTHSIDNREFHISSKEAGVYSKINDLSSSKPEDSIIIPETSSELEDNITSSPSKEHIEIQSTPEHISESLQGNNLVPSEELICTEETEPKLNPQVGFSINTINISAKINIKIHVSEVSVSSSESANDNNDEDQCLSRNNSNSSKNENDKNSLSKNETLQDCSVIPNLTNDALKSKLASRKPIPRKRIIKPKYDKSENFGQMVSERPSKSITKIPAMVSLEEELLNEVYGNVWRTPEVLRELHSLRKDESETKISLEGKRHVKSKITDATQPTQIDESLLADFSQFRLNVKETNLDSTRLPSPKTPQNKETRVLNTEKRTRHSKKQNPVSLGRRMGYSKTSENNFKIPQSNYKVRKVPLSNHVKLGNWRNLIDDERDSEGENASDDSHIDKTFKENVMTDDEDDYFVDDSDKSWNESSNNEDIITSDEDSFDKKPRKANNATTRRQLKKGQKANELIYLDLSKDEVTIVEGPPSVSPPANHDENFNKHIQDILRTCLPATKSKITNSQSIDVKKVTGRRKLFNGNFGDEPENVKENSKERSTLISNQDDELSGNIRFNGPLLNVFNKCLESVKKGQPIFEVTPQRPTDVVRDKEKSSTPKRTPKTNKKCLKPMDSAISVEKRVLNQISITPNCKYGFLQSLDVCVSKSLCHPDALNYRNNYKQKKEELSKLLYDLYNESLFNNDLEVPLVWNRKLLNTAGRCLNKKRLNKRTSVVELSEKVLTSADRLRCTLIHELCHAATWIFSGEGGHGATWKEWARKANHTFPELPKIGVCHQYDIEYKYTYKCTLCDAKSYFHSKSKKVENIRCSYCHGAIEIYLNKKDKEGNIMPTPVREPTGFAKFVKENYKQYKRPDLKHADVMKILSNEFTALKVASNI